MQGPKVTVSHAMPNEQLMVPPTRQLSISVGQDEEEGPLLEQLRRHGELRWVQHFKRMRTIGYAREQGWGICALGTQLTSHPPLHSPYQPGSELSCSLPSVHLVSQQAQSLVSAPVFCRHFDSSQRRSQGSVVATFFDLRAAIGAHDALIAPSSPPFHGSPAAPGQLPRSVRFVALGAPSSSEEGAAVPSGILAVEVTGMFMGLHGIVWLVGKPHCRCGSQTCRGQTACSGTYA